MINALDALSAYKKTSALPNVDGISPAAAVEGGNFSDMLKDLAKDTVSSIQDAEKATIAGATGKANLTDVVMAVSQAEMALQTVVTIRDKIINAYQEITRMGV